ncbi:tetraspanin family protein [Trichuris trichiura]|uniref:Tetraspanin n=1 Tax=Trichuris trichiura TaxID=36087 RepID=A0A077ZA51_TRITR|nr:tetraspanin family protein [Trichuris trichiura]
MNESTKQRMLRLCTCATSFIIWISGIAQFCLSLWLLYNHDVARNMTEIDDNINSLYVSFYLLLCVGAFIALTAFTGWMGAYRTSVALLAIYFICLVISCSAEFASSILASVHRAQVRDYVSESMNKTMTAHYGINLLYTNNFDSIQANLQCCGVNSYVDWLATYFGNKQFGSNSTGPVEVGRVPLTCCNPIGLLEYKGTCGTSFDDNPLTSYALYVNTGGCLDKVCEILYEKYRVNIGLAVGNLILQLLGMVTSLLLIRSIRKG